MAIVPAGAVETDQAHGTPRPEKLSGEVALAASREVEVHNHDVVGLTLQFGERGGQRRNACARMPKVA